MRIAVFDDEKHSRSELIHQLRQFLSEADIVEASNGAQALSLLDRDAFDLLFIDIHLGDVEGTTVASVARKLMPKAKIIFATAYSEYALQAFELQVDDYILKPFDPDRLRQVLARFPAAPTPPPAPQPPSRIAINSNRHTTLIDVSSILYIETDGSGRGCTLHTTTGDFTDNSSLGEYEKRLGCCGFYRIHKTCLVQTRYIQDIFPWNNSSFALRLQGVSSVLPIGRNRINALRSLLAI